MHTLTDSKATLLLCLAVVVSQICEITRNSTYSSSSTVIDYGASRKRICNFLLVINSNVGRISYRFRDTDTYGLFSSPLPCLTTSLGRNPLGFLDETYPVKTRGMGLLCSENCIIVSSAVLTDPPAWQTDGQTDGRATAYSALCICCLALKISE